MIPLFHTLESHRSLKIIPETRVFMDGHPIISYHYSIFQDGDKAKPIAENIKQDKEDNPDYLGVITFEKPGQIFNYTASQGRTLHPDEVEELIEYINHVRDNPKLWGSGNYL